jgi:hypothetical protein
MALIHANLLPTLLFDPFLCTILGEFPLHAGINIGSFLERQVGINL